MIEKTTLCANRIRKITGSFAFIAAMGDAGTLSLYFH